MDKCNKMRYGRLPFQIQESNYWKKITCVFIFSPETETAFAAYNQCVLSLYGVQCTLNSVHCTCASLGLHSGNYQCGCVLHLEVFNTIPCDDTHCCTKWYSSTAPSTAPATVLTDFTDSTCHFLTLSELPELRKLFCRGSWDDPRSALSELTDMPARDRVNPACNEEKWPSSWWNLLSIVKFMWTHKESNWFSGSNFCQYVRWLNLGREFHDFDTFKCRQFANVVKLNLDMLRSRRSFFVHSHLDCSGAVKLRYCRTKIWFTIARCDC